MADWRSYDGIPDDYVRLWAPRFERAAGHLLALARPPAGGCWLDIGTGTGAVPAALDAAVSDLALAVGCDVSLPMLRRAQQRVPALRATQASAVHLPFPAARFDAVTASFALSHFPEPARVLDEVRRVLKPAGTCAASDWSNAADECEGVWRRGLAAVVGADALRQAMKEVVPSDFGDAELFRGAFVAAGFEDVRTRVVELTFRETADEFIAVRALSSAGRYGLHRLGDDRWAMFRNDMAAELRRTFGEPLLYARSIVLVVGVKPRLSSTH